MTVLLDTSVLSEPLKERPDAHIAEWVAASLEAGAFTASIVVHEIGYGVARLPPGRRRTRLAAMTAELLDLVDVLSYDVEAARWHARERVRLEKKGLTPSYADTQIAAVAAAGGLRLATLNPRHFRHLDVALEDLVTGAG